MGKRILLWNCGNVSEEIVRNYIANQGFDKKDEIFKIEQ